MLKIKKIYWIFKINYSKTKDFEDPKFLPEEFVILKKKFWEFERPTVICFEIINLELNSSHIWKNVKKPKFFHISKLNYSKTEGLWDPKFLPYILPILKKRIWRDQFWSFDDLDDLLFWRTVGAFTKITKVEVTSPPSFVTKRCPSLEPIQVGLD